MERVTSASAEALLERAESVIQKGGVNVISVEAIRGRSHDKWGRTRVQVEEFIERAFARLASPRDAIVTLNDLEFLTLQPDASRSAALTLSANVLRETLNFFLGKAEPADLKLFQVTSFQNRELAVVEVDVAALDAPAETQAPSPRSFGEPVLEPVSWQSLRRDFPLASDGSRQFALSLTPEPTWNVTNRVVTSFLLRDRVTIDQGVGPKPFAGAALPGFVGGLANLQSLRYALELLNGGQVLHAGVHAPIFLEGLANSSFRYEFLRVLKATAPDVRRRLILELVRLPNGFPPSRMIEVVSLLAPYCRAVLARAPDERSHPAAWKRCGLAGVTLDCGHLDPSDRNAHRRLSSFASAAAGVGGACAAYALASRSLVMSAWAAGFTHIGGAAVDAEVQTCVPQHFSPLRLYGGPSQDQAA